jgi:hypothetical protein
VVLVATPFYRTWWFLTIALASIGGLILLAWKYRVSELKRIHAVQQDFARQLINSQESERKRIAAELHDSLGQHLLIIKNWAPLALSSLQNGDAARESLDEISSAAAEAIEEVRGIAYNLRPYQLESWVSQCNPGLGRSDWRLVNNLVHHGRRFAGQHVLQGCGDQHLSNRPRGFEQYRSAFRCNGSYIFG